LYYPYVVAVDKDDNIYVASYNKDLTVSLQVFDNNGTFLRNVPLSGIYTQGVKGLAIDKSTGDIYVAYNWIGQVVQLSKNGTLLNLWDYGANWIICND
jgi:DNA-binding beta-propeller fold protein YncE